MLVVHVMQPWCAISTTCMLSARTTTPVEVAALAREIVPHDTEVFGNQLPAYRAHPMAETLRAIKAFESDPGHARRYTEFHCDMVCEDTVKYAACLSTLSELARLL
jgi:hypothetical protein